MHSITDSMAQIHFRLIDYSRLRVGTLLQEIRFLFRSLPQSHVIVFAFLTAFRLH